MEGTKDKMELINLAIHKLIEEKKNTQVSSASDQSFVADDEEQHLLSRLLSQLESLKGDGALKEAELSAESPSTAVVELENTRGDADEGDSSSKVIGTEEIVKELRKVERQNSITHWLLSIMIVLTFTWQLSEVTLLLKVKNGLSQPFRSFGSLLRGMLKGPSIMIGQDGEKQSSSTEQQKIEPSPLLPLKIPELPHLDLSNIDLNGKEV